MIRSGMEETVTFSFSQKDVEAFAQITGDNNPIHLDTSYAAQTPFKKPIMHGFLGGSIFSICFFFNTTRNVHSFFIRTVL